MPKDASATQAVCVLRKNEADFTLHRYGYVEKGGAMAAAEALGVEEHTVIKTIVMETDRKEPFLVLMHGDRKVSLKALASSLEIKNAVPCTPDMAHKHTGYFVGGISPFGTRKPLKVYMEASIAALDKIYINAGKRGLLACISVKDLVRILNPAFVSVAA
jgi:Cys-tRNA(Pro) deacylase